jgi:anti-anti-sigma regulatory factor
VASTSTDAARALLASLLAQHGDAITDAATDWVIAQAVDLRGKRPREETFKLVSRVVAWNRALILQGDDRPLAEFIQHVTALRASSEFRPSTLLRGFVSFRMGLLSWLVPPLDPEAAIAVLKLVDDAYFAAIFRMTDEYVGKLHQTVVDRREQLEAELAQLEAQRLQEHASAMHIIRAQEEALNEVSLPILRVFEGVLVMPLIGELTAARASALSQRLLTAIVEQRARLLILDITALQALDQQTAALLIRAMQAVRLLGSRGMIAGMSAEAAARLVSWRIDLSLVQTYSTLADGLLAAQREYSTPMSHRRAPHRGSP